MKSAYLALVALAIAASCSKTATTPDAGADGGPNPDVSIADAGDSGAPLVLQQGCNPLAQEYDCLLPYPSNAFLTEEGVVIGDVATPHNKDGEPVRAFDQRTADGFSVHPSILFTFGEGLDPESLVAQADSTASVMPTSPTLLIDTETREAVPHFSEVYLGGGPDLQIGAIRPLMRLAEGRRYVVALQNVQHIGGDDVTPPRVFAALRDGSALQAADDLRARYDDEVFSVLDDFGVDRAELDLAWDFTTRSREDLMGDMLSVRAGTLAWLESNTPTVTITDVIEGDALGLNLIDNTFRHIEGHFTAPLWTETNAPGARLRGPQGAREITGTLEVPFTITIPNSIGTDDALRGPFIQYGHGFFGRRDEVISEVQSEFGNEYGFVMGSVDWMGMMRADRDWVVGQLIDAATDAFAFVPRVHQGMANQLVFTEVVRSQLINEAALSVGTGRVAYEPEQIYFLGISQGHILGGTFFALSPSIDKAVLNVGGASFGLILTRSNAFLLYERLLAAWLGPIELLKFEAIAPQVMEVIDPVAFAPLVLQEPLEDAVPKQILLQGGIGDSAVPNVSMELHARALGISLLTPTPASIPFIDTTPMPAPSGLTFVDFGVDPTTARAWQPVTGSTIVHEEVRRFDGAREQMNLFLRPEGQIEDTCAGPCVVP